MNITELEHNCELRIVSATLRNTPEKEDSSKDGILIGKTDFSLHFLVRLLPLKGLVAYKGGCHARFTLKILIFYISNKNMMPLSLIVIYIIIMYLTRNTV